MHGPLNVKYATWSDVV